jgi:hypothetical protein
MHIFCSDEIIKAKNKIVVHKFAIDQRISADKSREKQNGRVDP